MRLAITHATHLTWDDEVTESVMDVHLGPRDDTDQRVERFRLRVEPPMHVRRYEDGFGNAAHLLTTIRPYTSVEVIAESEVQTFLDDPFITPSRAPRALDPVELADGLDPSPLVPHVPVVAQLAEEYGSNDAFETVHRLMEMIYRDFTYRPGVTDVSTSIEQVIDHHYGVCQDFAHLLIGLCRSLGIPARYASGYIVPSEIVPSEAGSSSRGAGASHAWVEAFTPTHGWRGFDPTNSLLANERYVKIAIGRDYRDVPPTRGTYRGQVGEGLDVEVSVRVLDP
jgi:transglutaminase-like putative cysteine protease